MAAKKKAEALTGKQAMIRVLRTCTACQALAEEGARKCVCGAKLGGRKTRGLTLEAAAIATGLKGATPMATLAASLAVSNAKSGDFIRTAPGTYDLRERHGRAK